jgi:hypothetical protein
MPDDDIFDFKLSIHVSWLYYIYKMINAMSIPISTKSVRCAITIVSFVQQWLVVSI